MSFSGNAYSILFTSQKNSTFAQSNSTFTKLMLQGKKIILGISGGIAAYKTPELARLLIKAGAEVKVVCTESALQFVTALTLETLTHHKVYVDMFQGSAEYHTEHIALADWADMMIVAPATANIIAKMAQGIADDALSTTYLAFTGKVLVVPAMNVHMYEHPATQHNIQTLTERAVCVMQPESGELACGVVAKGRMPELHAIVRQATELFMEQYLAGKHILVTAGPTYEKIDPVRFIGNYSSGKMGCAIAEVCAQHGALVTLIAGPMRQATMHPSITRIDVESAQQMFEAATEAYPHHDAAVLCAAVADFTPETTADQKLKRGKDDWMLHLKPTTDIAAALGKMKTDKQVLVGFALETNDEQANAQSKLERKNFDFIVLNSLRDKDACFGYDTNKITIINKNGSMKEFPLKPKSEVAEDIVAHLSTCLH